MDHKQEMDRRVANHQQEGDQWELGNRRAEEEERAMIGSEIVVIGKKTEELELGT